MKREPKREPRPLAPPGFTTHGHDAGCRDKNGTLTGCVPECRNGQPLKTLRLHPEDD